MYSKEKPIRSNSSETINYSDKMLFLGVLVHFRRPFKKETDEAKKERELRREEKGKNEKRKR